MKRSFIKSWRSTAVLGMLATVAPAFAGETPLPPEQHSGAVSYVSGGVGEQQAKMFENQMGKFDLAIEVLERAGRRNEFTANAEVKILDKRGHSILDTKAAGPFMLVDLPPGKYSVEADLAGRSVKRSAIQIAAGHHAVAKLEFPSETD